MTDKKAAAFILAAGFCWGFLGFFNNFLSALGLAPLHICVCRAGGAALLLLAYLLIKRPRLLKIRLRDLPYFLGTGSLGLSLFNLCYFTTISNSQVSVAAGLLYASPVFVTVMARVFFGETLTLRKYAAILLTLIGCTLVSGMLTDGYRVSPAAMATGLSAAFFYSLYTILGRKAMEKYHPLTVNFYTFATALFSILPFAALGGVPVSLVWGPGLAAGVLGISLVCTVLPYFLYSSGLQYIEAGRASVLATSELVTGTVIGTAVFHEPCNFQKVLGLLLILGAIIILNTSARKVKGSRLSSSNETFSVRGE